MGGRSGAVNYRRRALGGAGAKKGQTTPPVVWPSREIRIRRYQVQVAAPLPSRK